LLLSTLAVQLARSGHELPVYPSYYPHEIHIETVAPDRAPVLLTERRLHAQLGSVPSFAEHAPASIRAVDSLGSFVALRFNPASPFGRNEPDACAAMAVIGRELAAQAGDIVFHPYPVTPFHGDYLNHADLAAAAKTRMLADAASTSLRIGDIKVRTERAAALGRTDWAEADPWDAEITEFSAADLIASATVSMNGWLGPAWLKSGWFHAYLLLANSIADPSIRMSIEDNHKRLVTGDYESDMARINLERDLVTAARRECRAAVIGYTIKREYLNDDFSTGVENIAYDSLSGLNSTIFIRTVKLKDFPWNGWLALGVSTTPAAAWNPIAGFSDEFGRLMWSAIGDPGLLLSPYDSSWMLNRMSGIEASRPQKRAQSP